MLIDNPNSLNEWLINVLEPICDADPQALAKYIMALIKKDRPQDELKKICLEQLEVFLVNETSSFVDILFDTLNNKSYLNNLSTLTNPIEQPRSPRSHRNVPAPSGSSRRYQNHQLTCNNSNNKYPQQQQDITIEESSLNMKKRRSRSKSPGKSYKRNRSRSPQQENHYGKSRRCRDYDEKGYCMRGNLCSFDHGVNPLILDSTNANTVLGITTSSNSNNQNSNLMSTSTNQYTPSSLASEPYNPEAPGLSPASDRLNKNFKPQIANNSQYRPTVSKDSRNGLHKNNIYLHDNDEQTYKRSNRPFKPNNKRKPPMSAENQEKTTLEVRKIPAHLNTIANLNEHFSKFGTITNLKIGYDNDSEAALVQFASNGEALSAYRSTEAVLNNRFIKVFWHSSSNQNASFDNRSTENGESEKSEAKKQAIKDRLDGIAEKQATITNTAVNNLINSGLINSNTPNQLASLMLSAGNVNSKLVNKVNSASAVSKPIFNPALLKKQYTPVTTVSNNSTTSTSTTSLTTISTAVSTISTPTGSNVTTISSSTTNVAPTINKTSSKITNINRTNKLINSVSSIKLQPQPNKEKLMKKLELQKKRQEMLSTFIQQNRLLIDKLEKAKTDVEKQAIRETLVSLSKQIKQLEDDIKRENCLIIEETNMQKQLSIS